MSDKIEICIKQANRENDWWICSLNEAQQLHKLLKDIKKSGKKEKLVYENINGDKIVLEGSNENNIISYKESDPSVKRMVLPLHAPKHPGFIANQDNKSKSKSKKTSMSLKKKSLKKVTMKKSRKTKLRKTRK